MAVTQKPGKMKLGDIKVSYQDNWRGLGNLEVDYGIATMVEQILDAGKIITPVVVEQETGELLRGFRRVTAANRIVTDPKAPQDCVKNLTHLDVVLVSGLDDRSRMIYRYDEGSHRGLSKSEIIESYFKFRRKMFEPTDVYPIMYQDLAKYTGKTEKIAKVETLRGPERSSYLKDWFKGTVEQFFEYAYFCGPVVQEQLILTEKGKERTLTDEEKGRFLFAVDRKTVKALYDAKKTGDAEFKAKMDELTKIAKGEIVEPKALKPLTKAEVTTQIGASGSSIRKAILDATLDSDSSAKSREAQTRIEAELVALEGLQDLARKSLDTVKDSTIKAILMAVAYPTIDNNKKAEAALTTPPVEAAPATKKKGS